MGSVCPVADDTRVVTADNNLIEARRARCRRHFLLTASEKKRQNTLKGFFFNNAPYLTTTYDAPIIAHEQMCLH